MFAQDASVPARFKELFNHTKKYVCPMKFIGLLFFYKKRDNCTAL